MHMHSHTAFTCHSEREPKWQSLKPVSIAVKLITVLSARTELLRNITRPPGTPVHPRPVPSTIPGRHTIRHVSRIHGSRARSRIRAGDERNSEFRMGLPARGRGRESGRIACLPLKGKSQCQSEPVSSLGRPAPVITVNALNASESNLDDSFSRRPGAVQLVLIRIGIIFFLNLLIISLTSQEIYIR